MAKTIEKCSYSKCRYPGKLIIQAGDQTIRTHDKKYYHDTCLIKHLRDQAK